MNACQLHPVEPLGLLTDKGELIVLDAAGPQLLLVLATARASNDEPVKAPVILLRKP